MLIQFLFKIQIYNKNNNTWRNLYHTPYQPSTNISSRAYGLRADIGVSGWYGVEYDFYPTHNSLDKIHIQPQTMGYPIFIL